jgi:hypothetical protein
MGRGSADVKGADVKGAGLNIFKQNKVSIAYS